MRKYHNPRRVLMAMLLLVLLLGNPLQVYAAGTEITFMDDTFHVSGQELLENLGEIMPGDSVERSITVKNASDKYIKIYITVSPKDEQDKELLKLLSLRVMKNESLLIDNADARSEGTLDEAVLVAAFRPGQKVDLDLSIFLSAEAGNECMGLLSEISWVFEAEVTDAKDPSIPQTGDSSNILLWVSLMIVSLLAFILLVVSNKKLCRPEYDNEE